VRTFSLAALKVRTLADLLSYPFAVAIARWIAVAWLLMLPPNQAAPRQLHLALLAYGIITTLFAVNFWHRSRASGKRDELHPLVVPALIAIDVTYAALAMKLYGITLLLLLPAFDAAMLAVSVGVGVLVIVYLVLLDLGLNFHVGSIKVIGWQIAALMFGPYLACLLYTSDAADE